MARNPSQFAERLDALIERWALVVPEPLQESFREAFRPFGVEHDAALDVIEHVWSQREHDYTFDELGLARRRPFHDHLVNLLRAPATPARGAIGILFVDVDRLKQINDKFGHDAGDQAVAAVGTILRDALRTSRSVDLVSTPGGNSDDGCAVSRHGGDEFLVALELREASDIAAVSTRLKSRIDDQERQRKYGYSAPVPLTASLGGVAYALPPSPPRLAGALAKRLVDAADEQMYASKRDGRVHLAFPTLSDALEIDRDRTETMVL